MTHSTDSALDASAAGEVIAAGLDDAALYRSAAVAQVTGLPVATLRMWERRYRVVAPTVSAGGHRRYRAQDVRRLALLKRLVDGGHAISAVAPLATDALAALLAHDEEAQGRAQPVQAAVGDAGHLPPAQAAVAPRPWWIVGSTLAGRLARGRVWSRLAAAGAHWAADAAHLDELPDAPWHGGVLVIGAPIVQPALAQAWVDAVARRAPARWAVLYGLASADTERLLRRAGAALRREPLSDAELVDWLLELARWPTSPRAGLDPRAGAGSVAAPDATTLGEDLPDPPPRRYSDAVLVNVAAIGSDVACDCPRHVAELLLQVARFEDYSAQCRQRSPADAALHERLHRLSGQARRLFEEALEHVAVVEGISLNP